MACAGRSPSCESAGPLLTQAFAWCNDPPVGRRFIPGFGYKRPRRAGNCCAPAPGWEFVDEPAKTAPHDVIPRGGTGCSRNPRLVSQSSEGTPCSICIGRCRSPAAPYNEGARPAGQAGLARLQDRVPVVVAMPQQSRSPVRRNAASPSKTSGRLSCAGCPPIQAFARSTLVRGPGSGVVVFVPQLVSKAARRGDRLDGEAVFEAA
jgi:hypothetical protein